MAPSGSLSAVSVNSPPAEGRFAVVVGTGTFCPGGGEGLMPSRVRSSAADRVTLEAGMSLACHWPPLTYARRVPLPRPSQYRSGPWAGAAGGALPSVPAWPAAPAWLSPSASASWASRHLFARLVAVCSWLPSSRDSEPWTEKYVTTPTVAQAMASSATRPAISLPRSVLGGTRAGRRISQPVSARTRRRGRYG